MSSRQAIVLASRVLCAFFLYIVFDILTALPSIVSGALNQLRMTHMTGDTPDSVFHSAVFLLGITIFRLAAVSLFAIAFYQCGPRIAAFLTGETMASDSARVDPA